MVLLLNLMARTILQNLCKDRDYFLRFKKIGTNLQKGPKVRDQNAYLLNCSSFFSFLLLRKVHGFFKYRNSMSKPVHQLKKSNMLDAANPQSDIYCNN